MHDADTALDMGFGRESGPANRIRLSSGVDFRLWTLGHRKRGIMRDHTKLRAFEIADNVVMEVYRVTRGFPKEELFGLTSQVRRAAMSIASNIVEGCARNSEGDYLRFLDMSYGSAKELEYQLSVADRLGYSTELQPIRDKSTEAARVLNALINSIRRSS